MSRAPGSVIAIPKRQRCAIYTRKSSEEGLDMEGGRRPQAAASRLANLNE